MATKLVFADEDSDDLCTSLTDALDTVEGIHYGEVCKRCDRTWNMHVGSDGNLCQLYNQEEDDYYTANAIRFIRSGMVRFCPNGGRITTVPIVPPSSKDEEQFVVLAGALLL